MEGNIILLLLVIGPMAAAIISYIIGRSSKSARDYFADVVTILEFAVIAFVACTLAWTASAVCLPRSRPSCG